LTGIGEGIIISLSFTFLGLTRRTDRNLAIYLVLLLSYGALGLWAMPTIIGALGLKAIFIGWAIITFVSLTMVKFVPSSSNDLAEVSPDAVQLNKGLIATALLGCLVFNTAISLVWANLFLIGMEVRPDEQSIANALLIAQFVAIPGALLALVVSSKIPRWALIIFGFSAAAASMALLLGKPEYLLFIIAVSAFNFIWNFVLPFLLSVISDMDIKGRTMAFAIACQMIGLGFGPGIASKMLGSGTGFDDIKILMVKLFLGSLVIILVPVYFQRKAQKAK